MRRVVRSFVRATIHASGHATTADLKRLGGLPESLESMNWPGTYLALSNKADVVRSTMRWRSRTIRKRCAVLLCNCNDEATCANPSGVSLSPSKSSTAKALARACTL